MNLVLDLYTYFTYLSGVILNFSPRQSMLLKIAQPSVPVQPLSLASPSYLDPPSMQRTPNSSYTLIQTANRLANLPILLPRPIPQQLRLCLDPLVRQIPYTD